MTLRVRLMAPGIRHQHIILASMSNQAPIVRCRFGAVTVSPWTSMYDDGARNIYVCRVTISQLEPFTSYEYSINQPNGQRWDGTFRTLPGNQETDYGVILATCDSDERRHAIETTEAVRALCAVAPEPVLARIHIDDIDYVHYYNFTDAATGIAMTGRPDATGLVRDFAAGWYANMGGIAEVPKWRTPSRDWMNCNLPLIATPGDHGFEDNHCRGGVGNADYAGCNRTGYPGATIPELEDNALEAYMAFFGQGQEELYLREGKLQMGLEIGPVRLGFFDHQLYCLPYDPTLPSPSDLQCYGAEQIADIKKYLNVSDVPFKIACFESGLAAGMGQPYYDWHPDEASAWAADWMSESNLNGVSGNFTVWQGDNHRAFAFEGSKWWAFCPGVYQDSNSVNYNPWILGSVPAPFAGTYRWRWQNSQTTPNGLTSVAGFWWARVFASESPKRITMQYIHGNRGPQISARGIDAGTISPIFTLVEGAADNQWTYNTLSRVG